MPDLVGRRARRPVPSVVTIVLGVLALAVVELVGLGPDQAAGRATTGWEPLSAGRLAPLTVDSPATASSSRSATPATVEPSPTEKPPLRVVPTAPPRPAIVAVGGSEPVASPRPAATRNARATPRPTAAPAGTSAWGWPLLGPITQYFGQSLTKYGLHQGIDIDGQTGDPVRAARAGVVTLAGRRDDCSGLQVTIDHGGGIESWSRHLSGTSVRVGQRVARGEVVGRVGNTGCSLGSHLHFAILVHGRFVDPLRYLPRR